MPISLTVSIPLSAGQNPTGKMIYQALFSVGLNPLISGAKSDFKITLKENGGVSSQSPYQRGKIRRNLSRKNRRRGMVSIPLSAGQNPTFHFFCERFHSILSQSPYQRGKIRLPPMTCNTYSASRLNPLISGAKSDAHHMGA